MIPAQGRTCGSCTFCCKVLGIGALEKPAGRWCAHCKPGRGCTIYEKRPGECADFACQWLVDPRFPEALRPDKVKVMVSGDQGGRIIAHCDPDNPAAWRSPAVFHTLKSVAANTWASAVTVLAVAGRRTWLIAPAAEYDLGVVPEGGQVEMEKFPDGTARVGQRGAS
jgi:hypothetical protein